jgi:hypothetical protein
MPIRELSEPGRTYTKRTAEESAQSFGTARWGGILDSGGVGEDGVVERFGGHGAEQGGATGLSGERR